MKQKSTVLRLFCAVFATILIIVIPCAAYAAGEKVSVDISAESGDKSASVSVDIPSDFIYFTKDDTDKDSAFFMNFPLTKNEVISRIDGGVVIDAFSRDKTREIRMTVYDSASDDDYLGERPAGGIESAKTTDLLSSINNLSALSDDERIKFMNLLKATLTAQGHTFLGTPADVEISGYHFIKTYARIGSPTGGYVYTSVMTVIGGRCYVLTCYENNPMPDQEMIDASAEVIRSLNVSVTGDAGELAGNAFRSVIAFIVIIIAVVIIVAVVISFIRQLYIRLTGEQQIKRRK